MRPRAASPVGGERLAGRIVGISISEAEDLAILGHPRLQLDLVLRAILEPIVAAGARIAYGGRFRHEHNFTLVISRQLGDHYRRTERAVGKRPFIHVVPLLRLQSASPEVLVSHLKEIAPYGEIWVSSAEGILAVFASESAGSEAKLFAVPGSNLEDCDQIVEATVRGLATLPLFKDLCGRRAAETDTGLTLMRQQMARLCDARFLLGGRKSGFSGPISGLCEEAIETIRANRPLYVLGGFGGSARDIASALGFIEAQDCVPRGDDEPRYSAGLDRVSALAGPCMGLFPESEHELLRWLARTESALTAGELAFELMCRYVKRSPVLR